MGCIYSYYIKIKTFFIDVDDAKAVSKRIDKEILLELKNEPDEIEILILGAPESGKSTLLKQVICNKCNIGIQISITTYKLFKIHKYE